MKERRRPEKIVAIVMAGGEGKRLRPLTADRCKPSVPFGGSYRLVDFVLSTLINSGIHGIYVLVQYKPQSMIDHVRKRWILSPLLLDQFVTVVPPQMHGGKVRFRGTADAVYQSLKLLQLQRPDMVAVFSADHVYRMDVNQMVRFHREHEADVSIAARPVPIEQTENFGILEVGSDGQICGFEEKPVDGKSIPSDPQHAYASMGNYLFDTTVLRAVLEEAHERGDTDFGHDVLPHLLLDKRRLYAYDFTNNHIPGMKRYEENGYWRDVGTLDAYFDAHQDMLGMHPRFDTFNPQWPIYSSHYQGPVARIFNSFIDNSLVESGAVVDGAVIRNSIIRREVVIEPDVELDECIIMDYVKICRGARLRRVIIDRHNLIEAGSEIGFDAEQDDARYQRTPSGIVVVPKGRADYFARDNYSSATRTR